MTRTEMEKIAMDIVTAIEHGDATHRQWLRDTAAPLITAALTQVRAETIAECAKVADRVRKQRSRPGGCSVTSETRNAGAREAAQEICMTILALSERGES